MSYKFIIDTNILKDDSVDGIVSNEQGFMRVACKELFPEKEFLSVDEFVNRIKRIG